METLRQRQSEYERERVNISVVIRFCMPALISSCLAAGALATLSALVNVTPRTCQCDSTQPIFTSQNGSTHTATDPRRRGCWILWETIWTASPALKKHRKEDTISTCQTQKCIMQILRSHTQHRKSLFGKLVRMENRLAVTQGFYTEYWRTSRRKSNITQRASLSNKAKGSRHGIRACQDKTSFAASAKCKCFLQLLLNY